MVNSAEYGSPQRRKRVYIYAELTPEQWNLENRIRHDVICTALQLCDNSASTANDTVSLKALMQGIITYLKPREELTENEKAGVDGLTANGISPTVKPEDPTAAANIDLVIDGEPWEMKNVTNISSASNQVKRAHIKWMKLGIETPMKSVFTTVGATIPFDDICDTLSRRRREGEQFIVLSEDQELREM